ncbi:MAG: anthranilate phosphoribosyltransferase, partial [Opitutae bacterium]
GDLERNMEILDEVLGLKAKKGLIDSICFNAGAALWCAGKADCVEDGIKQALDLLSSGAVANWLAECRAFYSQ